MPPKKTTFGRGYGRHSQRHTDNRSPREDKTPVKIKEENLRNAGHFVSPDRKKRVFTIKRVLEILRAQDNTEYQEDDLRKMLTVWRDYKKLDSGDVKKMPYQQVTLELQNIQKRLLGDEDNEYTIEEVTSILRSAHRNKRYQLENIESDDMKQMVMTWKRHNDGEIKDVDAMDDSELRATLEKIKSQIEKNESLETNDSITEEVDKETDELFETMKQMNVSINTTDAQIKQYSKDQLVTFYYIKSLKMDHFPSLEEVQTFHKDDLIAFCREWRDEAKREKEKDLSSIVLSSEDEDDLYEKNENVGDIDMTDAEEDNEHEQESQSNLKDEDEVMTDMEEDEAADTEIKVVTKNSTDAEINQCTFAQLVDMYEGYANTAKIPISRSTLNLWTEDILRKSLRVARDKLAETTSSTANIPSSNLKTNRKYAGKPKIQTDLNKNTAQTWRYNLFFTQPHSVTTMDDLRTHMGTMFDEMKKYQSGAKLLPWATTDTKDSIAYSEELPTTITGLKKYFPNLRAPTGVAKQYIKWRIFLPIQADRNTFEADYTAWCNSQGIRMYFCSVQQPHTKIIGWLVYAPNTMDRDKWCRNTQELYTQLTKDGSSICVGLSWKALAGQWDAAPKDKVYAMHVETTIDLAPRVKTFLRMIAQRKLFPLGVRFRVMDQYTQYMKETTKVKYKYILDKHRTCLKELRRYESGKILNLDYRIGSTKMTLRDIVVNIRDNSDGRRIFNSIDTRYDRPDIHVAMYRPDKAAKAEAFMDSLPTYVQHLYPTASLSRVFTIEAMDQSEHSEYYPNTQTFLTQEDIELDKEIQMDWDDDSFEHLKTEDTENPFKIEIPIKLPGGTKLYNFSGDDETASTIPATASNLTFTNASVHLYDANSTVSGMSTLSDANRLIKNQIKQQIQKLNANTPVASQDETQEVAAAKT